MKGLFFRVEMSLALLMKAVYFIFLASVCTCMKMFRCSILNSFVSICRFNEFGPYGGPAAKSLEPKFNVFSKHVSGQTGIKVPEVQVRIAFGLC